MSKRDKTTGSPAQAAAKQAPEQAGPDETKAEAPDIASGGDSPSAAPELAAQHPGQEPDLAKRLVEAEEAFALASEEIALKDARIAELEGLLARANQEINGAAEVIRALEQRLAMDGAEPAGDATPAPACRPNVEALKAAHAAGKRVEVTYIGGDHVALVAGLPVDHTPREFSLATVFDCGRDHVKALANDPTIRVRIVD